MPNHSQPHRSPLGPLESTNLPAGNAVLSASADGSVRAFDLLRYRNFRTFASPEGLCQLHGCVCFFPRKTWKVDVNIDEIKQQLGVFGLLESFLYMFVRVARKGGERKKDVVVLVIGMMKAWQEVLERWCPWRGSRSSSNLLLWVFCMAFCYGPLTLFRETPTFTQWTPYLLQGAMPVQLHTPCYFWWGLAVPSHLWSRVTILSTLGTLHKTNISIYISHLKW